MGFVIIGEFGLLVCWSADFGEGEPESAKPHNEIGYVDVQNLKAH